jgi:hypothetical protein
LARARNPYSRWWLWIPGSPLRGALSDKRCALARGMTVRRDSVFPRRDAPELCMNLSPNRGRGEYRVPAAPAASRAMCWWHTSVVTTGHRIHPAFPHAMVLTASFVLSPVIGLSCHRRLADMVLSKTRSGRLASAGLDAGVEASGPHDFAVRSKHLSSARPVIAHRSIEPALPSRHALRRCCVHRIPPRVRDDRDTPLVGWDGGSSLWGGTAGVLEVIWVGRERKYFCKWDWTQAKSPD